MAKIKSWKEIWGSGQGIGAIKQVQPAAQLVAQLASQYAAAKSEMRKIVDA